MLRFSDHEALDHPVACELQPWVRQHPKCQNSSISLRKRDLGAAAEAAETWQPAAVAGAAWGSRGISVVEQQKSSSSTKGGGRDMEG